LFLYTFKFWRADCASETDEREGSEGQKAENKNKK
jgi:hypothetical protein